MKNKNIIKAASFFLTSWPDSYTAQELLEGLRGKDPDIIVAESFELEEHDTVAAWIEEVADIFSK